MERNEDYDEFLEDFRDSPKWEVIIKYFSMGASLALIWAPLMTIGTYHFPEKNVVFFACCVSLIVLRSIWYQTPINNFLFIIFFVALFHFAICKAGWDAWFAVIVTPLPMFFLNTEFSFNWRTVGIYILALGCFGTACLLASWAFLGVDVPQKMIKMFNAAI